MVNLGARARRMMVAVALGCGIAPAGAANWTVVPSIALEETLTDNVNLDPNDNKKGDLVTQVTPSLLFNGQGAHAKLAGFVSVPVLLYVKTGDENNTAYVNANILGNVEAIDKFFYIEGAAIVSQQFLTPFGAQPVGLSNATQNRYTASTYRISPYLQGEMPGRVTYLLRNNSYWTTLNGAPITTNDSFTSEWVGKVESPVTPLGWTAEFDLTDVKFTNQSSQTTNLGRVGARYAYNPQLQVHVDGGYEENQFPLASYKGPIYGIGFDWRPTERTNVGATWEHRYFGSSYLVNFNHRTPLSVWNFNASRNTTSYPQQLAALPAGNVQGLLNQLFLSRIPDPAQRQIAIDTLIQSQGLPANLASPVSLYTQQILLTENATATLGLLGARNSVFMTLFYLKQQPISGSGTPLPPGLAIASVNDNTQTGANVVWTHNLTSAMTLSLMASALRTVANEPFNARTNQGSVNATVSTLLSARTTVFAGARYQVSRPNFVQGYNEAAIFAGVSYAYK
jgi:uncharacterized protein (PEP-CTERM system associated)